MAEPIGSFSGLASGIQWRDMVDQIMNLEAARKLGPLQSQAALHDRRQPAWSSFGTLVGKLNDAAKALRDGSAFGVFTSTAGKSLSGKELFGASASSSAAPGSYSLEVIQLARAEKLNGQAQTSATAALGLTGDFYLHGKRIDLASGDTLTSLRDKINAANSGTSASGVTATILSTTPTSHRLILTADHTGSRGIELIDGDAGVLTTLGILDGSLTRNASPADGTRTESARFAAETTALSSMLGLTAPPARTTISFGGVKVEVDLATDTLISVMNRVTSAGGSASIVEETVGGATQYRLSAAGAVTADAAATDPAASQRIVELLGFERGGQAETISAGQDAVLRVDGFKLTRRTNTVSDAINGVTLDLKTANASERTSLVAGIGLSMSADPKTIDAGTYAIGLTSSATTRTATTDDPALSIASDPGIADGTYAVSLSTTTTRSTSASIAQLSVAAADGTVAAGSYDVAITQAATQASMLGTKVVSTNYGTTGDYFQIVDNATGITGQYTLTAGQSLDSVIAGLNNMFSGEGMRMSASNVGGKLQITHSDFGADSSFTVAVSANAVKTHFGLGETGGITASGVDVAGTIGGVAATGDGQTLTGSGALAGLQVQYTGTTTGSPVGSVTVTDTTAITGGTIGGEAATWDAGTGRLTAAAGGSLAGLTVGYSGPVTSGAVGNVVVSTTGTASVSGATIDGEAAVWDAASQTIRGAAGSRFDGLVLGYAGAAVTGDVGSLTVSGDIAATLTVNRDVDSIVSSVDAFATAFNGIVDFVDGQRAAGSPLQNSGALRSIVSSLKSGFLANIVGLSAASTSFSRGSSVGLELNKTGKLDLDTEKLKAVLATNQLDVQRLFSTGATTSTTDLGYLQAGDLTKPGSYTVNVTQAATRATLSGSTLAAATYSAADPLNGDTLTITDASSGTVQSYVARDGASLATVVSELNSLFANSKMKLAAEIVTVPGGSQIRFAATDYGSASGFTLAGAATTGLGFGAGPVTAAGLDVQGTFRDALGSYAATGLGQILVADAGSPADGLQMRYSGSSSGDVGTLDFTLGLAGMLARIADPVVRTGDGTVALQNESIDRSRDMLTRRMDDVQTRLDVRRESLIQQFVRMEQVINSFNAQSSWLSSQISALQPPSSQ